MAASIWLHVAARPGGLTTGLFADWLVVMLVAAGTTPYLAAMVAALAIPTIVGASRRDVIRGIGLAPALGLVTLSMWWASGYFVLPEASDLRNTGFGVLSTNLLAPFQPPEKSLLRRWIHIEVVRPDQLDGYCYLGLGLLFLTVAAAAVRRWRIEWPKTSTDIAFAGVLTLLTLFAISSTVTLGPPRAVRVRPGLVGPLTAFRASGRLIWPVFYAFVVALLTAIVRDLRPRPAAALLSIGLALQVVDLWGATGNVAVHLSRQTTDPLPSRFWPIVPPHYRHLVLNPTNMCSPPGAIRATPPDR